MKDSMKSPFIALMSPNPQVDTVVVTKYSEVMYCFYNS